MHRGFIRKARNAAVRVFLRLSLIPSGYLFQVLVVLLEAQTVKSGKTEATLVARHSPKPLAGPEAGLMARADWRAIQHYAELPKGKVRWPMLSRQYNCHRLASRAYDLQRLTDGVFLYPKSVRVQPGGASVVDKSQPLAHFPPPRLGGLLQLAAVRIFAPRLESLEQHACVKKTV
jgi:hypothetical protein